MENQSKGGYVFFLFSSRMVGLDIENLIHCLRKPENITGEIKAGVETA